FNDVRAGEAFLNRIYAAVTASPAWEHTVLFINFDEWGGFFDHVPPPAAPIPEADRVAGNADGLRGFRTPALLISPFARAGRASHGKVCAMCSSIAAGGPKDRARLARGTAAETRVR